jgi:hypothetical protein
MPDPGASALGKVCFDDFVQFASDAGASASGGDEGEGGESGSGATIAGGSQEELEDEWLALIGNTIPDAAGCVLESDLQQAASGFDNAGGMDGQDSEDAVGADYGGMAHVMGRRRRLLVDPETQIDWQHRRRRLLQKGRALQLDNIAALNEDVLDDSAVADYTADPTDTDYIFLEPSRITELDGRFMATGCLPWEISYDEWVAELSTLLADGVAAVGSTLSSAMDSVTHMADPHSGGAGHRRLGGAATMDADAVSSLLTSVQALVDEQQGNCDPANLACDPLASPAATDPAKFALLWNRLAPGGFCLPVPMTNATDCSRYGESQLTAFEDADGDNLPDAAAVQQVDWEAMCVDEKSFQMDAAPAQQFLDRVVERAVMGECLARLRRRILSVDQKEGDFARVHPRLRKLAGVHHPDRWHAYRDDFGRRLQESANSTEAMEYFVSGLDENGDAIDFADGAYPTFDDLMELGGLPLDDAAQELYDETADCVEFERNSRMQHAHGGAGGDELQQMVKDFQLVDPGLVDEMNELVKGVACGVEDDANDFKKQCCTLTTMAVAETNGAYADATTMSSQDTDGDGVADAEEFGSCFSLAYDLLQPLDPELQANVTQMASGKLDFDTLLDAQGVANATERHEKEELMMDLPTDCFRACASGWGAAGSTGWVEIAGFDGSTTDGSGYTCTPADCELATEMGSPADIMGGMGVYYMENRRRLTESRRLQIRERRRRLAADNQAQCLTLNDQKFCEVAAENAENAPLTLLEEWEARGVEYAVPALMGGKGARNRRNLTGRRNLSSNQLTGAVTNVAGPSSTRAPNKRKARMQVTNMGRKLRSMP